MEGIPTNKRKLSEEIAQQTAEFLARGGEIHHAEPGEGRESQSWKVRSREIGARKSGETSRQKKQGRSRERLNEIFAGEKA